LKRREEHGTALDGQIHRDVQWLEIYFLTFAIVLSLLASWSIVPLAFTDVPQTLLPASYIGMFLLCCLSLHELFLYFTDKLSFDPTCRARRERLLSRMLPRYALRRRQALIRDYRDYLVEARSLKETIEADENHSLWRLCYLLPEDPRSWHKDSITRQYGILSLARTIKALSQENPVRPASFCSSGYLAGVGSNDWEFGNSDFTLDIVVHPAVVEKTGAGRRCQNTADCLGTCRDA